MIYTIFENSNMERCYPFTINHSLIELRFGAFSILERIEKQLSEKDQVILVVRDELKDILSERYPHIVVNPDVISPSQVYHVSSINLNESNLILTLDNDIPIDEFRDKMVGSSSDPYLWDYLKLNSLDADKDYFDMVISGNSHKTAIFVNKDNIHISESSVISAGVILDASNGPIIIDDEVVIDIGALIKGPTYIGKGSKVNPGAKLRGNISIGPYCKIGGEVEDTTFHGYSNKQHDGYLGHSYIGEWVNLGANTNNSDLKNNYSKIKFKIGEDVINTNEIFLGAMIGDYTKTGISTMINTGTYVGVGCNLFGSGFQRKNIPSFTWGENSRMNLDKFLNTLEIVKNRRGKNISNIEKDLITKIYNSLDNSIF